MTYVKSQTVVAAELSIVTIHMGEAIYKVAISLCVGKLDLYYIANIQDKFQTITQRTKYVSHIDASLPPSQMYFPVIPSCQSFPIHSE